MKSLKGDKTCNLKETGGEILVLAHKSLKRLNIESDVLKALDKLVPFETLRELIDGCVSADSRGNTGYDEMSHSF